MTPTTKLQRGSSLVVTNAVSDALAWRLCPQVRSERRTGPTKARYKDRTTGDKAVTALRTDVCVEAVINVPGNNTQRAVRAAVTALTAASLLCACSNGQAEPSVPTNTGSGSASPPSTSSSPSPGVTDPSLTQALDAYQRYWAAQVSSQARPTRPQDAALAQNARGQALAGAQSTLLLFRQNGVAMTGRPVLHPVASKTVGQADVITISDCVDSSNWKPVYIATGKSALAPGQAARVVLESTVVQANGRWLVATSNAQRDRSC